MRERADVVVVVPFYFCTDPARADITRRVFRSLHGVTVLGIGSEGDISRDLFTEHHPADRYRHYEQTWAVPGGGGSAGLRDKFDFGIREAAAYRPDHVFLIGSDDFMVDETGRPTLDYFKPSDADLIVATGGVYLWRAGTRQCHFYPHPCPADLQHTGGALGFSRRYLDRVKWRPYQNPDCEQGAERFARELGARIEQRPHACLTVRCKKVLNSPNAVQRRWRGARTSIDPFLAWWSDMEQKAHNVSVIIPFAGDCPWRKRALEWVTGKYEQLGWEVVVGHGDPDRWCKADAVADALPHASGDLLVIADGDVWADDIERAVQIEGWAVPHRKVHRLDQAATELVLDGAAPHERMGHDRGPYIGVTGGGILIVPRDLYEQVPLDPRFVGWGGEDHSIGYALTTLAGKPGRFDGNLWHLWHPKQAKDSTYGSAENASLKKRYRAAKRSPELMRALLDEVMTDGAVSA